MPRVLANYSIAPAKSAREDHSDRQMNRLVESGKGIQHDCFLNGRFDWNPNSVHNHRLHQTHRHAVPTARVPVPV